MEKQQTRKSSQQPIMSFLNQNNFLFGEIIPFNHQQLKNFISQDQPSTFNF
jgi:hypothetical protein